MLEAPLPENEAQRLAALLSLGLLDTAQEQRFNRITRSAARLLRVPLATITLLDAERQWFKSRYGLFSTETPRKVSFCGHAILGEGMLVVPDALKDQRFSDNPLVTGQPHIRFYAGRPLSTPGGMRVGTLCVMDREPRILSEEDHLALEDLAAWAEIEINFSAQLARSREHLQLSMEPLQEGILLMRTQGNVSWANTALIRWLGHESLPSREGLQHLLAQETLEALDEGLPVERLREDNLRLELDAGFQHRDGRIIVTRAAASASLVDGERILTLSVDRNLMR